MHALYEHGRVWKANYEVSTTFTWSPGGANGNGISIGLSFYNGFVDLRSSWLSLEFRWGYGKQTAGSPAAGEEKQEWWLGLSGGPERVTMNEA